MKKILSLLIIAMMAIPLLSSAHGPSRQKVEEKIFIKATPEKVWAMIGDFSTIDKWHPMIVATKMEGDDKRVLTIGEEGGPTITESLKKRDNEKMMLKYKIVDMSVIGSESHLGKDYDVPTIPVHNYLSTITVKAVDGGTEVTWQGKFYRVFQLNYEKTEPRYPKGLGDAEAVESVTAIYKAGLESLKKICEEGGC